MSIYTNFKPTRLYVKRHLITGMLYFGKTVKQNTNYYRGSGVRWSNHISKYGRKQVETIWVSEWFDDPLDIEDFALLFSDLFQITGRDSGWANIIPENGLDGGMGTEAQKEAARKAATGRVKSDNEISSIREAQTGRPKSEEHKKRLSTRVSVNGEIYLSIGIAAANFGISPATAGERLRSKLPRWDSWQYLDSPRVCPKRSSI